MTLSNVHHAPPFLLEKMNNLCCILWQEKNEFEQVANVTSDKDLRTSMLTIAQESNQYVCELCAHMQTLGGVPHVEKNNEAALENVFTNPNDENDVLSLCQTNEKKLVGAYREMLNESSLYEGLRRMIGYQLNAMVCNFTHMQQLRALKLH